jgi:brefeldin A-resistance guanine nucleotide exchange factor 1
MIAITYLRDALLGRHGPQTATAPVLELCFNKVLFHLLFKLLEPVNPQDPTGMQSTRIYAADMLSQVFVHHLTSLRSLSTFIDLWIAILCLMERYMRVDKSSKIVSIAHTVSCK